MIPGEPSFVAGRIGREARCCDGYDPEIAQLVLHTFGEFVCENF
jgi:hypothetical protein